MLDIKTWEDVGGIVTIFTAPLILLSVLAAFRQMKIQADISRKDLTFNGLLSNAASYQKISDYLHDLKMRYELGDKTVNYRCAYNYYSKYWLHTVQQWDFFESGLIPYETFLGWSLYAYKLIAGEHEISFFDQDGAPKQLNSREVFEGRFIGSVYKNHQHFYEFYYGLYKLKSDSQDAGIMPETIRRAEVIKYLKTYMKKRNIKSL